MTHLPEQITRQQLYDLAWSKPMQQLAKDFNMSDVGLAKVCKHMHIPRPVRGHWAKREHGKPSTPEPLPPSYAHDCVCWQWGSARDQFVEQLVPITQPDLASSRPLQILNKTARHPLVTASQSHFDVSDSKTDFIKPRKRLLIDLFTSETHKDSAFAISHLLFATLAQRGYDAFLAPQSVRWKSAQQFAAEHEDLSWRPQRPTFLNVGGIPIGLKIVEGWEDAEAYYVHESRRYFRIVLKNMLIGKFLRTMKHSSNPS